MRVSVTSTSGEILSLCYVLQIGSRSSVYSPESTVRKTGSYIYEEFMPTDGTDVKACLISCILVVACGNKRKVNPVSLVV